VHNFLWRFSCTVIPKVHNFAPIKFTQTMKNKLFLALALAGVMACDKDKPVTPNNANDVSTQIQDLINNLDPTQAQALKDALVPDNAMKTFLLEGKKEKEWILEMFETVQQKIIAETSYTWRTPQVVSFDKISDTQYENIGDYPHVTVFNLVDKEQEEPTEFFSNKDWQTIIYNKDGQIKIGSNKDCNVAEMAINVFIPMDSDENKKLADELKIKYKGQKLCVSSYYYQQFYVKIITNAPKKIENPKYEDLFFKVLSTETGEILHKLTDKYSSQTINGSYFYIPK
jgi:hypothetical protein